MMFQLLQDWVLDPLGMLLLWTLGWWLLGGLLRVRLAGRVLVAVCWYAGVALTSAPAIVNPLVGSLEQSVPPGDCPADTPIVVLGGGVDGSQPDATRYEAMSSATLARISEGERLALADLASVIVTGGRIGQVSEADFMAAMLGRAGLAPERIVKEDQAMSTADNASRVAALLAPDATVRLVTSALHMPRALATFEAAGVAVCAVPVDYLQIENVPAWALWPQTSALRKFDRWWHEWLALAVYRWRGDL